jgi:NADH-quinone oxidoreductase subunit F
VEPILTRNIAAGNGTTWIDAYEANGGYSGLRKAAKMSPDEVIKIVTDSGLLGRGGAGFPTGKKWASMLPLEKSAHPRYLVVNYDEMEPGTFKDRFLVEGDPHQLVEGIAIAAYACQADIAIAFVRYEYRQSGELIQRAICEARDRGYVGKNALGTGWSVEVHTHLSAGRYMCGEETGMLNSLEGEPARPRAKPPYPGTSGLFGKPTVVDNVETLSCVPHIIERGAEWFKSIGKGGDAGPKIYGVSGKVKKAGAWELPIGTSLRELVEEHAGGMLDGCTFRAALPGGASTKFMGPDLMDVPLGFTSLKERGLFFGTGTAIVLDDRTCPVALCRNLAMFYARESCGWCTPCREGLPWVEKQLRDIEAGKGREGDIDFLLHQAKYLGPNTYCALATGAMFPLESAIEMFREDFDEHIRQKKCPYASNA